MKKIPFRFIFFALISFFTSSLAAQSQLDLTIHSVFNSIRGYETNTFTTLILNSKNNEMFKSEDSRHNKLIGDIKWNYFFGPKILRVGFGARIWTLGYQNAVYPIVSLESELGDFVLDFNVGGGVFGFFGEQSYFASEHVMLPELSIAYGFGEKKNVLLGASVTGIITGKEKPLSQPRDRDIDDNYWKYYYNDDYHNWFYYEADKDESENETGLLIDFSAIFSIFIRLRV